MMELRTRLPQGKWRNPNEYQLRRDKNLIPPLLTLEAWDEHTNENIARAMQQDAFELIARSNPLMEGYIPPKVALWRRCAYRIGDALIALGEKFGGSSERSFD